jgi:hypothetical protein
VSREDGAAGTLSPSSCIAKTMQDLGDDDAATGDGRRILRLCAVSAAQGDVARASS